MAGDPYWDNVQLLLGFEDGLVTDESPATRGALSVSDAADSTAQAKFGTHSLAVSSDGFAATSATTNIFLGTSAWTIEGWFRWTTGAGGEDYLVCQWESGGSRAWAFGVYGTAPNTYLYLLLDTDGSGFADEEMFSDSTVSISTGTWHHIAADFDGTTYRMYFDGVNVLVNVDSYSLANISVPITVGANYANPAPGYGFFEGFADEVRLTAGVARYASNVGFSVPTEAYPRGPDMDVLVEEGIEFGDATGPGAIFLVTETDTTQMASRLLAGHPFVLADTFGVIPHVLDAVGHAALCEVSVDIQPELGVVRAQRLSDGVGVLSALVPNSIFGLSLSDGTTVVDAMAAGWAQTLADEIGVEPGVVVYQAIQVIEALGLTPALAGSALYGMSAADAIRVVEAVSLFFGATVEDVVEIDPSLAAVKIMTPALADGVGIAVAQTPSLVLRVTAPDRIDISDAEALSMLYAPTLADGVQLSAAYLSPGGGFTTWAMNTRTGAVTEYSNYQFNSFARVGDRYVGATENGLYELLGDDDDGDDIIAQIKSGFAQFAGARFTLFKAIYLGVRGEGDFVLRLEDGEGHVYNYGVATRDMRSTKVHLGKGLRARYFRFELISTGQDFDLESIEFVPLVADRRV